MSELQQFLSADEFTALKNTYKALSDEEISVTCVGLYNHGKSTLLNALIKDYHLKTFKVADKRETTTNKRVVFENIQYVDTPGLNACEKDDAKVLEAIVNSDITLFVHNLNTGEFNQVEMNFLHSAKRYWQNDKDFIQRTVFVLTRIDEAGKYEDIENTKIRMNQQIQDIFACEGNFIPVSAKNYIVGKTEDEDVLIEESRFDDLVITIDNLAEQLKPAIITTKKTRFDSLYNAAHEKLQGIVDSYQQQLDELVIDYKKQENAMKRDIRKTKKTLKRMYQKLEEVE